MQYAAIMVSRVSRRWRLSTLAFSATLRLRKPLSSKTTPARSNVSSDTECIAQG